MRNSKIKSRFVRKKKLVLGLSRPVIRIGSSQDDRKEDEDEEEEGGGGGGGGG